MKSPRDAVRPFFECRLERRAARKLGAWWYKRVRDVDVEREPGGGGGR